MTIRNVRKSIRGTFTNFALCLKSRWARVTFAQECEDLLVLDQFRNKNDGFYVEIGGLHPVRFSNTYLFYRKGWRGIVVEPNPDAERNFRRIRKRDIFIAEGVGSNAKQLEYFRFTEPALNTFDADLAHVRETKEGRIIKDRISRPISPLRDLLASHLPADTHIDLMSIDVEGMDDEVLRSNDWDKYRPSWLIAEIDVNHDQESCLKDLSENLTYDFLVSVGYQAIFKTGRSVIFKCKTP